MPGATANQWACVVTSCVDPSLKVSVAVKAAVWFGATDDGPVIASPSPLTAVLGAPVGPGCVGAGELPHAASTPISMSETPNATRSRMESLPSEAKEIADDDRRFDSRALPDKGLEP